MSVQLIKGTSENGGKQLATRFDPAEDLPKIVLKGEPRAAYGSIFANVVYEGKAPPFCFRRWSWPLTLRATRTPRK